MKNPPYLSLNEAAKETGRSKGTISKALSSGKMSYVSKENGRYQIDPSELERVFPKKQNISSNNGQKETPKNTNENSALKKENELLREQLKREQDQADHWRQQAERMTLLLTNDKEIQNKSFLQGFKNFLGTK